jgi:bifunctional enzyme Fae/Hps
MSHRPISQLDSKKRYLQLAFNNTLEDARKIIAELPLSQRILIEAGTPLIKRYGMQAIRNLRAWAQRHFSLATYIVADLKTMDRGETEVALATEAGANAVTALGSAPKETLDSFIASCEKYGVDAMIDMMNVEFPLNILRSLKKIPQIVILHRGVDEEAFNKEKQIPYHEIQRLKGNYNVMISIAGGDTLREVQRAIFNDADIVVVWKSVHENNAKTLELIEGFLKEIK